VCIYYRAAELGNSKACQLLVSAGSDINAFESNLDNLNRFTESSSAFIPEHGQQVTWSKCHAPIGGSALHLAVEHGHVNTVQTLIQLSIGVNFADRNGVTPLMLACMKRGSGQIVHLLTLIPGCDVKLCDRQWKKTALHFAAEAGDADVMNLLIDAGVSINQLFDEFVTQ
jgi:ankyrin repeat protein